ncbi:hypothetical protein B0H16DRAFT_1254718, partial [Mycena metata]
AALALAADAASASKNGIATPDIFPLSPVGNVAAVQDMNGDTRLYSQNPDNTIQETGVTSPFNGGGQSFGPTILVSGGEVLGGTPIAA